MATTEEISVTLNLSDLSASLDLSGVSASLDLSNVSVSLTASIVATGGAADIDVPILGSSSVLHVPTVSGAPNQDLTAPMLSGGSVFSPWIQRTAGAPATASAAVSQANTDMGITVTLPTDPTTTTSITCSTAAEVRAAIASGAHITITGDMTGETFSIPSGTTDMIIDGSTVNAGSWTMSDECRRIHFDGLTFQGLDMVAYGSSDAEQSSDVQITDCKLINGGHAGTGTYLNIRGKRVVVNGCETIDRSTNYVVFVDNGLGHIQNPPLPAGTCEDLVFVNNLFMSGTVEACVRIYHTDGLVFTGNTLDCLFKHNFRLHSESTTYVLTNAYVSHNQLEARGFMLASQGSSERVHNILVQNTVQTMRETGYGTDDSCLQFEQDTTLLYDFTFEGNWLATDGLDQAPGNASFAATTGGLWTWTGNTTVYLDGSPRSSS